MSRFEIGKKFTLSTGEQVEIVGREKGKKINKENYHSGIIATGLQSKPCFWVLSNGNSYRGKTLLKLIKPN